MNRTALFLLMTILLVVKVNASDDKGCTLKVQYPKEMFHGALKAQMTLHAIDEEGEKELGLYELKDNGKEQLTGEWQIAVSQPLSASLIWTEDPHLGFAFMLEQGTITAIAADDYSTKLSGTPLNDAYAKYQKECTTLTSQKCDSLAEVYMKQYANTPLFALLFSSHSATSFFPDSAKVERLWNIGGPEGHKNKNAKNLYDLICHNNITNGEPLRDVEISHATTEGEGQTVRLSDYLGKGKWVFLDFWASWCGGCRQAIPLVKKVYEELKDENIQFISIAEWDRRQAALKAIDEEQMPWLQLIDEKGACGDAYLFNTIPRFMLFTPDGRLAEKDVQRNQIRQLLSDSLKGTRQ